MAIKTLKVQASAECSTSRGVCLQVFIRRLCILDIKSSNPCDLRFSLLMHEFIHTQELEEDTHVFLKSQYFHEYPISVHIQCDTGGQLITNQPV